jgi:Glyoxalase-like domain
MELDHVLLAVAASDKPRLPEQYGLEPYEGGRHPGWGTANWIVPLGEAYIELVAVVDEHEARGSAFGRWVAETAQEGGGPIGWAVRPNDLDATAARLGLEIADGSRTTPAGKRIDWRSAGIEEAATHPWLPFFVDWRDPAAFPGATVTPAAAIVRVEIEGDAEELSAWLGEYSLPIEVRPGGAGVTAVVLEGAKGVVTLGRRPGA